MDSYELYLSLALAAAAGLLIGIERERSAPRDESAESFIGASLGGWAYGRRIARAFAIVLAAGGAAVLWARQLRRDP